MAWRWAKAKGDLKVYGNVFSEFSLRNFNKMYDYLTQDMRYGKLRKSRRDVVFAWTQREYRNLMLARNVIDVPTPYAVKDNIILMEFIGDDNPAPKLKDCEIKNPKKMFDEIIKITT